MTCRRCSRCGHHARGLCRSCYDRWYRAGRPADVPGQSEFRSGRPAMARREDYLWMRDEQGLTRPEAAARLGVCERTAWRYEAWYARWVLAA